MPQSIANLMFPGVDYNTIIELLGEYICKVLLEGSADLTLEINKILGLRILRKVVVLIETTNSPHKTNLFFH